VIRGRLAGRSGDARLVLHPSVRLFSSPYPAHSIWTYNREGESDPIEFASGGECGFFARPDRAVVSYILAPAAFAALENLSCGRSLRATLEAGPAAAPDLASAALLSEIVTLGIITDIETAMS
ncbi:MAG TPA: hypothetical protein VNH64_10945, partial [Parvularculaceae bacterium]|nr:hypothetical protein [Parvularculaceae bacterium]